MSKINQTPYADIAACNEGHLAFVLITDTSGSMNGKPAEEVVQGIEEFKRQIAGDDLAMKRVDIAIVSMGGKVKVEQDFIPASKFVEMPPLSLSIGGDTPMGEAITRSIELTRERNRLYASLGTPFYKPWIFLLTDGEPTDDITNAKSMIRQREDIGRLKFFSVGVNGANMSVLKSLSSRTIIATEKDSFKGIFNWLSESMSVISQSRVDENPQLPNLPEGFADARKVPDTW